MKEGVITRKCFILAGLSLVARAQKALFDDADFSGWQSVGVGAWTAEGGELVGRFDKNKPGPGYIFTREVFTDFRMALLFNISSGGRSCIYVREPRRKWGLDGENRPGSGPSVATKCSSTIRIATIPLGRSTTYRNRRRWLVLKRSGTRWKSFVRAAKSASPSRVRT